MFAEFLMSSWVIAMVATLLDAPRRSEWGVVLGCLSIILLCYEGDDDDSDDAGIGP